MKFLIENTSNEMAFVFVLINWQTLAHSLCSFYSDQNNKQKRMKNELTEHAIVSPGLLSLFNGKPFGRIKARSKQ